MWSRAEKWVVSIELGKKKTWGGGARSDTNGRGEISRKGGPERLRAVVPFSGTGPNQELELKPDQPAYPDIEQLRIEKHLKIFLSSSGGTGVKGRC